MKPELRILLMEMKEGIRLLAEQSANPYNQNTAYKLHRQIEHMGDAWRELLKREKEESKYTEEG